MRLRIALSSMSFIASVAIAGDAVPVAAPMQNGAIERFGIAVDDRYRPLENLETPDVQAWVAAQARATRDRLASLPGRAALRARYDAIDAAQPPALSALQPATGDRMFFVKRALGETIGRLYVKEGQGPERMLVDTDIGPTTRFAVSPDGRRVLLAQAGAAASTVTVVDVAAGAASAVLVDDAWNAATPRWRSDGTGFHYIAVDGTAPRFRKRLMTYRFKEATPRASSAWQGALTEGDAATIVPSSDGRLLYVAMHDPSADHLRVAFVPLDTGGDEAGGWTSLIGDEDGVQAITVHGSAVYGRSMRNATLGRLLRYDAARPARPPVVVFEGTDDGVLQDQAAADDGVYLVLRRFYAMSLLRLPFGEAAQPVEIALPHEGSLRALATDPAHAGAVFVLESWTDPATQHRAERDRVTALALQTNDTTIGRDWIADNLTCQARDGARIPMTVVHRKGIALDGSHPLLLNGYGGYGFVEPAYFYPKSQPWVEHDGIFADFMARGSGATGEDWHRAGTGASKAKTWTDLEACAETLFARGYTSPAKLVIQGTGIGGLMVGRAATDRPDLFAAAVMRWGITDALRFMESPAHRPADELELGRPDSAAGVAQLLEDSVDAHIANNVRYPAMMLTTGLKDTRFPAWMQLKTAARLQAVSTSASKPVLLRVDETGGAGLPMTRDQRNDELVDRIAFLLWIVGDPDFQPKP